MYRISVMLYKLSYHGINRKQRTEVLKCGSLFWKLHMIVPMRKGRLWQFSGIFICLKNLIKQSGKKSNLKFHYSTPVTSSLFLHLLNYSSTHAMNLLSQHKSIITIKYYEFQFQVFVMYTLINVVEIFWWHIRWIYMYNYN